MTEHERIWLEPAEQSDPFIGRSWCQDNQWGHEGVEYVLASTLESLQRENARLERERAKQWRRARRADASRDTYAALAKTFEAEANQLRDVSAINRHRAEAAEAEVKRLQAEIDRKSSMPGDHRYWEGRYRDEAAENEKLRGVVERAQSIVSTSTYPNWHDTARQALASTGGEHHGN